MSTTSPYAGAPPEFLAWYDALFRFDALSVRQKLLAIAQKYYVEDLMGVPRFYVVRPPKLLANVLAGLCASGLGILFFIGGFSLYMQTSEILLPVLLIFVGNIVSGVVGAVLAPYRDITVFTDETESVPVLLIRQENKLALYQRYTLHDPFGVEVAEFRRNNLTSILRRTWEVLTPAGEPIAEVREDHLMFALLRRYFGTLYGLLRTNFEFVLPDGTIAGKYDRKLTITDQYLLDLRGDPGCRVDRRVALAAAILLDTAESR